MGIWMGYSTLILFSSAFFSSHGLIRSRYTRSEVFEELKSCEDGAFHHSISSHQVDSAIKCGLSCSINDRCRRFMFDTDTKECSMFECGGNCFTAGDVTSKTCFRQMYVCQEVNCSRCPIGYYGNTCQDIIKDCQDGKDRKIVPKTPMLSFIQPSIDEEVLEIKCDFKFGKTIVQARDASCKETDFNRPWNDYVNGFGHTHGEYWLGLKHMYNIMQYQGRVQLIVLIRIGVKERLSYYPDFSMFSRTNNYTIFFDRYRPHPSTPLGDSLFSGTHGIHGRPFSTYDRDYSMNNCPVRFNGSWWYLDIGLMTWVMQQILTIYKYESIRCK
ncbi:hypothetical protein SNE40_005266 [Patella caerulea]|uniref:Fibrinogen C-terminal domain-containing protein n=1 Tax=Patella caerulea TaxID=87958 RepID=A0AAN8K0I6_PATCE